MLTPIFIAATGVYTLRGGVNVRLSTALLALGWDGQTAAPSVRVVEDCTSSDASKPALILDIPDATVAIYANITGRGGDGGGIAYPGASGDPGEDGGDGLYIEEPCTVSNFATISAGGGGGGAVGSSGKGGVRAGGDGGRGVFTSAATTLINNGIIIGSGGGGGGSNWYANWNGGGGGAGYGGGGAGAAREGVTGESGSNGSKTTGGLGGASGGYTGSDNAGGDVGEPGAGVFVPVPPLESPQWGQGGAGGASIKGYGLVTYSGYGSLVGDTE